MAISVSHGPPLPVQQAHVLMDWLTYYISKSVRQGGVRLWPWLQCRPKDR